MSSKWMENNEIVCVHSFHLCLSLSLSISLLYLFSYNKRKLRKSNQKKKNGKPAIERENERWSIYSMRL